MRVRVYHFLLFCLIIPTSLFAQPKNLDCLPNKDGWSEKQHFTLSSVVEILGSVEYYSRTNGTQNEIFIDWDTFSNKCPGLSDSAAKEIIQMDLVGTYATYSHLCRKSDGVVSVAVVYKTECSMVTKCLVTIDQNQKVECSDDPGLNTELFEYNGRSYHIIIQRKPCGYSCCEAIYTYNCKSSDSNPELLSLFKQEYPGATCTGSSNFNFIDCITGLPVLCEHDCK